MLKTLIIFIFCFQLSAFYAQEASLVRPKEINSASVKPVLIEQPTVVENEVTTTYLVKDEAYYTHFIEALKGKKAHLQSDSTLNAQAEAINWFSKINTELEKAELELKKIKDNEK